MSKSRGNVVDPFDQIDRFGVDPVRYFLLKEGSLYHDGDYSEDRLGSTLNSDLADTLGNLLQRVTSKKLNPQGAHLKFSTDLFPLGGSVGSSGVDYVRANDEDYALVNRLMELPGVVRQHYEEFEFNRGIAAVMGCLHQTNQFVDHHKPWQLVSSPADHQWLQTILCVAVESLRLCSCLLHPVLPRSSTAILQRLGFLSDNRLDGRCVNRGDLHCLLANENSVRKLEAAISGRMKIGGTPLFRKVP